MARTPRVFAVPDLHFPFHDAKSLARVYDAIADLKPDVVIQLGDVLDMYAWARFARSLDVMTPAEELRQGIGDYQVFWKTVKKIVGTKKRMIQLGGNHTDRMVKLAANKAPELTHLIDIRKAMHMDGLELHVDSHDEVEISGTIYVHGWLSGIGKHARYFNMPVVHGHTHTGGLWTQTFRKAGSKNTHVLFELDCGHLADPFQVPLMYRATKTTTWTKGFGVVDEWGPRFCPL